MKPFVIAAITSTLVLSNLTVASATASPEEFPGLWSRDCGNGQTCQLRIEHLKSLRQFEITFSIEGGGQSCSWSLDSQYQQDVGGPVAYDPHGNYFFALSIQKDGSLYSSGTMLQTCGPQPLDQYFGNKSPLKPLAEAHSASFISEEDLQAMVDNREIFDHNGSAMVVDPAAGSIVYRDPKKSIAATVKQGTLLFKANAPWDPYDDGAVISGIAYVFKRGCKPAPYEVSGRQEGWHTLILKGAAPVRAKNGCNVLGYKFNGNSALKFESWGD